MAKPSPLQAPLRIGTSAKGETRTQFGALCFRRAKTKTKSGAHEILLVSSRDTGRWIVPKGWPVNGETPAGAAALEAWEEAGVRGRVHPDCIGHFSYHKWIDEEISLPVIVSTFQGVSDHCLSHLDNRRYSAARRDQAFEFRRFGSNAITICLSSGSATRRAAFLGLSHLRLRSRASG
jgi:8-oxo-dGTP pyrophosphatase MutT (NUDIX family)